MDLFHRWDSSFYLVDGDMKYTNLQINFNCRAVSEIFCLFEINSFYIEFHSGVSSPVYVLILKKGKRKTPFSHKLIAEGNFITSLHYKETHTFL